MTRTAAALAALSLSVSACANAPQPAPAPPPPSAAAPAPSTPAAAPAVPTVPRETLSADTPSTTPGGATFTAPAGWTLTPRESFVLLEPPEKDARLAFVDVGEAADADAAVAAAWKAVDPAMQRKLLLATPRPGRNGWEERRLYTYETSPNERRTVQAVAHRAGKAWTVLLVDGADPTLEKRAAPANLATASLRPKGYARESFAGRTPHRLDAERVQQLRTFVERSAQALEVPGVAFSLIQDGKVVYEGGVGVRELGKPQKVDAHTLFLAASNTKALTTLLLARLVDAKKLSWEQPVVQVDPAFALGDAATTARVQVKHLVCACTGLPRQDLEWLFEFSRATPASAMRLLGTMQPTSQFGEVFQYSNLMAAAAGFTAGKLLFPGRELGAAYDAAMAQQVFEPLGMRATTFDFARALKQRNRASLHGRDVDGRTVVEPMDVNYAIVPARPAGGVWTSAHDLSRYVQLELARGKLPDGTQLVSEENLLARYAPQVSVGEDMTYGMGLMVDRTWGVPVVHHGGDLVGHHSDMLWLPEAGVGAVILMNADAGPRMRRAFLRRLLEVVYDGRPEAEEDVKSQAEMLRSMIARERERLTLPPDPGAVRALAPRYHSDALGELAVRTVKGRTVFDLGEWRTPVATRREEDGSLTFVGIAPGMEGTDFVVAEREGKRALVVRDGQHEYAFTEAAPGDTAPASAGRGAAKPGAN